MNLIDENFEEKKIKEDKNKNLLFLLLTKTTFIL